MTIVLAFHGQSARHNIIVPQISRWVVTTYSGKSSTHVHMRGGGTVEVDGDHDMTIRTAGEAWYKMGNEDWNGLRNRL